MKKGDIYKGDKKEIRIFLRGDGRKFKDFRGSEFEEGLKLCGRIFNLKSRRRFVNRVLICFFKEINNNGINIMVVNDVVSFYL